MLLGVQILGHGLLTIKHVGYIYFENIVITKVAINILWKGEFLRFPNIQVAQELDK